MQSDAVNLLDLLFRKKLIEWIWYGESDGAPSALNPAIGRAKVTSELDRVFRNNRVAVYLAWPQPRAADSRPVAWIVSTTGLEEKAVTLKQVTDVLARWVSAMDTDSRQIVMVSPVVSFGYQRPFTRLGEALTARNTALRNGQGQSLSQKLFFMEKFSVLAAVFPADHVQDMNPKADMVRYLRETEQTAHYFHSIRPEEQNGFPPDLVSKAEQVYTVPAKRQAVESMIIAWGEALGVPDDQILNDTDTIVSYMMSAGLEERVNLMVIRDSNDAATKQALLDVGPGWIKTKSPQKINMVPYGTLDKGFADPSRKGKWHGVLMFRRVATEADVDEIERLVAGLKSMPDSPSIPIALIVYASDKKVFDERLVALLKKMQNDDKSIVTFFVHHLWNDEPAAAPAAAAAPKPAVPLPIIFTGVFDDLLVAATKYAVAAAPFPMPSSDKSGQEEKSGTLLPDFFFRRSGAQFLMEMKRAGTLPEDFDAQDKALQVRIGRIVGRWGFSRWLEELPLAKVFENSPNGHNDLAAVETLIAEAQNIPPDYFGVAVGTIRWSPNKTSSWPAVQPLLKQAVAVARQNKNFELRYTPAAVKESDMADQSDGKTYHHVEIVSPPKIEVVPAAGLEEDFGKASLDGMAAQRYLDQLAGFADIVLLNQAQEALGRVDAHPRDYLDPKGLFPSIREIIPQYAQADLVELEDAHRERLKEFLFSVWQNEERIRKEPRGSAATGRPFVDVESVMLPEIMEQGRAAQQMALSGGLEESALPDANQDYSITVPAVARPWTVSDPFLREVVDTSNFYTPFLQADGSQLVVVPMAYLDRAKPANLYLQGGLANPAQILIKTPIPLGWAASEAQQAFREKPAGPNDVIVFNSEIVGVDASDWLIGGNANTPYRLRISPALSKKFNKDPDTRFMEVVALAARVGNGMLLLDYTYQMVNDKMYLILRSA